VAASQEIRDIDDVFRDATTREEPSLVSVDEGMDSPLEPRGDDFGNSLHDVVREGDRPELRGVGGRFNFREEDQERAVDAAEVNGFIVEGRKRIQNVKYGGFNLLLLK
jgi:hypothetical protein